MATRVTIKRQVTLPKALTDAAGIHPGDTVEPRLLPTGQIIIEKASPDNPAKQKAALENADRQIDGAIAFARARRSPTHLSTDEIMAMTRGDD